MQGIIHEDWIVLHSDADNRPAADWEGSFHCVPSTMELDLRRCVHDANSRNYWGGCLCLLLCGEWVSTVVWISTHDAGVLLLAVLAMGGAWLLCVPFWGLRPSFGFVLGISACVQSGLPAYAALYALNTFRLDATERSHWAALSCGGFVVLVFVIEISDIIATCGSDEASLKPYLYDALGVVAGVARMRAAAVHCIGVLLWIWTILNSFEYVTARQERRGSCAAPLWMVLHAVSILCREARRYMFHELLTFLEMQSRHHRALRNVWRFLRTHRRALVRVLLELRQYMPPPHALRIIRCIRFLTPCALLPACGICFTYQMLRLTMEEAPAMAVCSFVGACLFAGVVVEAITRSDRSVCALPGGLRGLACITLIMPPGWSVSRAQRGLLTSLCVSLHLLDRLEAMVRTCACQRRLVFSGLIRWWRSPARGGLERFRHAPGRMSVSMRQTARRLSHSALLRLS